MKTKRRKKVSEVGGKERREEGRKGANEQRNEGGREGGRKGEGGRRKGIKGAIRMEEGNCTYKFGMFNVRNFVSYVQIHHGTRFISLTIVLVYHALADP